MNLSSAYLTQDDSSLMESVTSWSLDDFRELLPPEGLDPDDQTALEFLDDPAVSTLYR